MKNLYYVDNRIKILKELIYKKSTLYNSFFIIFFFLILFPPKVSSEVSFLTLADSPYSDIEFDLISRDLKSISKNSKFIIHLGDIFSHNLNCQEENYRYLSQVLKESPIPVLIVPGDKETTRCKNFKKGIGLWKKYFLNFEDHWKHDFSVTRQKKRPENFSFFLEKILFIGINLVGSPVHDFNEWNERQNENLEWIKTNLNFWRNKVKKLVIFAHAYPGIGKNNDNYITCSGSVVFFQELEEQKAYRHFSNEFMNMAKSFNKPILYVNGNEHCWHLDKPFPETPNVTRVVIDKIIRAPMTKITVDSDATNEHFQFDRRFTAQSQWYKEEAQNGAPIAQYFLGQSLLSLEKTNLGLEWIKKSAQQNFEPAQVKLGEIYQKGLEGTKNYSQANKFFEKAIATHLKRPYPSFNKKVKTSDTYLSRIRSSYLKLIEEKKTMSYFFLGIQFLNGWGVKKDYKIALNHFKKAAKNKHGASMFNIGLFYLNGWGLEKSYKESLKWFLKSSNTGYSKSLYKSGVMYQKGLGTKQSHKEAIKFFKKAAEEGDAPSQFNLGVYYYKGIAVEKNIKLSKLWFKRAENQGFPGAKEALTQIQKEMP
jgi:TPR repeat protein